MANAQRITTGYVPRPLQADLHRRLKRFSVLVCHRRFGKTVLCVNEMIDRGLRFAAARPELPDPRFAYLAPFRSQAKDVAWDYLKRYTSVIPGAEPNEADLRIDIPRPDRKDKIRFQLLGGENPMALKGRYLDGGVLDEFGEMFPSVWSEAVRPTLADRGGWALFIGTPKGQNNFCELYEYAMHSGDPEWMAKMYKASETGIIAPGELESLKRTMSEEEYEQEFECSFLAGLVGGYFNKDMARLEKENRITSVPYDPALPVDTYWDLGMDDVTAIWFVQRHFAQFRLIDYMQDPDTALPEWVNRIRKKNYVTGKFYLPHDAKVRDFGSGKSRQETLGNLVGRSNVKIIQKVEDKLDSIDAARRMLPRCVFDRVKCEKGIKALKNYQRKWDTKQSTFSPKPLHNWASNAADAFQQFAMGCEEDTGRDRAPHAPHAETEYDVFNYRGA